MSEQSISIQRKEIVVKRARGCCEYCHSQARFSTQSFSIEHVIPRSQGGQDTLDNLALACQGCNNQKYTKIKSRDPVTGEIAPLYHPRQQKWGEHFAWNEDFTHIVSLTPTGRATVEALQLNRDGVVSLRQVLYAAGEHPPGEDN